MIMDEVNIETIKKQVIKAVVGEGDKELARMIFQSELDLRYWYDTDGKEQKPMICLQRSNQTTPLPLRGS